MYFDQSEYALRFEWGLAGIQALGPVSDVMVIVDVLSFTTSVDIVVGNGGVVFPYQGPAADLPAFAAAAGAQFAPPGRSGSPGFSLAPTSLLAVTPGTRLVLPSPNGSRLSLATGATPTLAGCLRNAHAVAQRAAALGARVSVIGAGERWPDGSLRPSLEDLLGAGAILTHLPGELSPEAEMARGAFRQMQNRLAELLAACGSGKELTDRGFGGDVTLAAQLDVSRVAPQLIDRAYTAPS